MKPVQDKIEIELDTAVPKGHELVAEWNDGTVEEHCCTASHCMPFERVPRAMADAVMHIAIRCPNVFPAKHGTSTEFSPRVIMGKQSLDCDKHLKCITGKCGQAHLDHQQKNDNKERTMDSMHFCPVPDDKCRGHAAMNLNTGECIT